jgi:transcriptional regulator with GAF, ATPase, and Fis domain
MKKTFDSLNLLFNLVFISGTVLVIFLLLKNPAFIFKGPVDFKLILIYCVLLVGLIAITLGFISSNTSIIKEIVYVNQNLKAEEESAVLQEVKAEDKFDYDRMRSDIDNILLSENEDTNKIEKILSVICNGFEAGQGITYRSEGEVNNLKLKACATYAYASIEKTVYEVGDGMVGLAVKEDRRIDVDNVPDGYINILSGLGKTSPKRLMILPVKNCEKIVGVLELAFFKPLNNKADKFLQEAASKIGTLI